MKIFLIRHGESILNTNENFRLKIPDHKVYLTERGKNQAAEAAKFLVNYLSKNNIFLNNARMWVSPYTRTRQTAKIFNEYLNVEYREDIRLIEQKFGVFDSVPYEDWPQLAPVEFELYQRYCNYEGQYYAPIKLGESRHDVALRVKPFFGTIQRDFEKHGIDTLFIVSHGVTNRAFICEWMHHTPEWFEQEKNPANCSIRYIDDNRIDHGYIFQGFDREGDLLQNLGEYLSSQKKNPTLDPHQPKLSSLKDAQGIGTLEMSKTETFEKF